jgi:hypothetical protein
MDERNTLIDELRTIRQQMSENLSAAEFLHNKLCGPTPKDTGKEPAPSSESVVSIVQYIRRQAEILSKMLSTTHDVIGNASANSGVLQGRATAAPGY